MQQNISSQMLKGILQGVMLMILAKESEYGYGISKKMNKYGLNNIPKGTIYPLLTTMEKHGLIDKKVQASSEGPNRKYYYITQKGEETKTEFVQEWEILQHSVNLLIEEEQHGK